MFTFISNNRKTFMLVFTAFLMVSFLVLPSVGGGGGPGSGGTLDGESISVVELDQYNQAWKQLQSYLVQVPGPRGEPRDVPLPLAALGPETYQQIDQNNDLFFLLVTEARQLGIATDPESIKQLMEQAYVNRRDPESPTRLVRKQLTGLTTYNEQKAAETSLPLLQLVIENQRLHAAMAKVTEPMLDRALTQAATLEVGIIDYTANAMKGDIAADKLQDDDLQAHFEKYKENPPGQRSEENPLGFGYRIPDKLSIQFIMIPKKMVEQAVRDGKTPLEWHLEAMKLYEESPFLFVTTPSDYASQSPLAVGPVSLQLAPERTRTPTTQPWEQARKTAIDEYGVAPASRTRMNAIRRELARTLASDFTAWKSAKDGKSTDANAAKPKDVTAPEYLQSFKVLQKIPLAVTDKDAAIYSREEFVKKYPKAAGARLLTGEFTSQGAPTMADYAFTYAGGLTDATEGRGAMLDDWRPSPSFFQDAEGNQYIFRIAASVKSHAPEDWEPLRPLLSSDVIRAEAMNLAKSAAERDVAVAAESGIGKVATQDRPLQLTGPIQPPISFFGEMRDPPFGVYTASTMHRARLRASIIDMLEGIAANNNPRQPIVVLLPGQGVASDKVVLMQLLKYTPASESDFYTFYYRSAASALRGELQSEVVREWAKPENVFKRMKWVSRNQQ